MDIRVPSTPYPGMGGASVDEEELVAKLFESAVLAARLAFAAEFLDAVAFRDLPDALAALFDVPLLEPV